MRLDRREFGSPIWEAGRLKRLAEIARSRGDNAGAEALEAESRSVYQEPEVDPSVEKAMNEAIGSGDVQKVVEALQQRFKS